MSEDSLSNIPLTDLGAGIQTDLAHYGDINDVFNAGSEESESENEDDPDIVTAQKSSAGGLVTKTYISRQLAKKLVTKMFCGTVTSHTYLPSQHHSNLRILHHAKSPAETLQRFISYVGAKKKNYLAQSFSYFHPEIPTYLRS